MISRNFSGCLECSQISHIAVTIHHSHRRKRKPKARVSGSRGQTREYSHYLLPFVVLCRLLGLRPATTRFKTFSLGGTHPPESDNSHRTTNNVCYTNTARVIQTTYKVVLFTLRYILQSTIVVYATILALSCVSRHTFPFFHS